MRKATTRTRGLLLLLACTIALALTAMAVAWPDQGSAPPAQDHPPTVPEEPQPLPMPEELPLEGGAPGAFTPA